MKKALKILLIVDACVAVAFLIGYEIREVIVDAFFKRFLF